MMPSTVMTTTFSGRRIFEPGVLHLLYDYTAKDSNPIKTKAWNGTTNTKANRKYHGRSKGEWE
jgi:hypothetical protein